MVMEKNNNSEEVEVLEVVACWSLESQNKLVDYIVGPSALAVVDLTKSEPFL